MNQTMYRYMQVFDPLDKEEGCYAIEVATRRAFGHGRRRRPHEIRLFASVLLYTTLTRSGRPKLKGIYVLVADPDKYPMKETPFAEKEFEGANMLVEAHNFIANINAATDKLYTPIPEFCWQNMPEPDQVRENNGAQDKIAQKFLKWFKPHFKRVAEQNA